MLRIPIIRPWKNPELASFGKEWDTNGNIIWWIGPLFASPRSKEDWEFSIPNS
jgi:hypothetical protein